MSISYDFHEGASALIKVIKDGGYIHSRKVLYQVVLCSMRLCR